MKKTIQPMLRKVYAQPTNAQDIQMNAVRKINSLLSSGAVSVTGPSQTRIVKQQQQQQQQQPQPKTVFVQKGECYICDEHIGNNGTLVTEAFTSVSNTKIPTKIGRIVGDAFMVIVSVDDVICKRCLTMFNQMDRLENDLDRVKSNILTLINKKYGINDSASGGGGGGGGVSTANLVDAKPPPAKLQRLNTGSINANYVNRKTSNGGDADDEAPTRKITTVPLLQPIQSQPISQFAGQTRILAVGSSADSIDSQLSGMFETTQQNNYVQPQLVRQPHVNATTVSQVQQHQPPTQQKKPIKIYKCMSCDFKTTDLKLFQPHYDTCRQQNGYRCKLCKKMFTNINALKTHNAEKHASEFTCSLCNINYMNETTFKKHMETSHPDIKAIETSSTVASGQQLYSCNLCAYKTYDKPSYDVHSRKHVKVKPFKCRICSARFETREQAGVHAKTHCPDYFKCGTCSMTFAQRDQLIKHFDTHKPQQQQTQVQQKQQVVQQPQMSQQSQQIVSQDLTTQKLLQDTIDEALRDTGDSIPKIHFFSCHICSLTFIQETYYKQHMETHKRENNKKIVTSAAAVTTSTGTNSHSLIRSDQRAASTPTTIIQTQPNTSISDTDLEIMFEKMHSDKAEIEGNANNAEGLVITSQESSTGGYTFNITMAGQQESAADNVDLENKNKQDGSDGLAPVSIDMPALDQSDEQPLQLQQQQQHEHDQQQNAEQQQQEHPEGDQHSQSGPVSMPSLDDDADGSQPSSSDQVPMDLDEIQTAAESGQIKFILNENGQLLQLDNSHILTTDSDGNQIIVQGTDHEQIQQLLQSVGVLQTGDGDGEQTFQMIQGENNQMILVQGDNNEAQLIDASMLNEDGQLVIQHHGDGELPEGMHVVNEDGVQVPVSIAFAQMDQSNVEHQQQQEQHELDQQQAHHESMQEQHQQGEHEQHEQHEQHESHELEQHEEQQHEQAEEQDQQQQHEEQTIKEEVDQQSVTIKTEDTSQDGDQLQQVTSAATVSETDMTTVTTSTTAPVTSTTGEVYFSLDEIMSQPDQK